jgi:hypothetical protein
VELEIEKNVEIDCCSMLRGQSQFMIKQACKKIQIFETLSYLSKQGCNMIQIFESLDLVLSNIHVTCFEHVISVLGSMAHTSHL